jgi:hygromycin-B 7''-O-kinase
MHSFPKPTSIEAFDTWRADTSQWLPVAIDIARSRSLSCSDPHVFSMGTNLVVAVDQRLILKPYLVMTRVKGVNGKEAWAWLPEDQRESVLTQIGEIIAEVQRVPVGDLSQLQPQWKQFIPMQIEGCRARHERLGLPQKYLDGLDDFLRDAGTLIPVNAAPVILTGEYNPENIFLEEHSGRWRLAALIDFADVMTGWSEYDLVGPSTFAAGGIPGRVRSLLRGFGYSKANADPALPRRLMTLLLLHRFSNLAGQIRIEDWQQKAADLRELERLLWPI